MGRLTETLIFLNSSTEKVEKLSPRFTSVDIENPKLKELKKKLKWYRNQ
jgi:hypothetical protein